MEKSKLSLKTLQKQHLKTREYVEKARTRFEDVHKHLVSILSHYPYDSRFWIEDLKKCECLNARINFAYRYLERIYSTDEDIDLSNRKSVEQFFKLPFERISYFLKYPYRIIEPIEYSDDSLMVTANGLISTLVSLKKYLGTKKTSCRFVPLLSRKHFYFWCPDRIFDDTEHNQEELRAEAAIKFKMAEKEFFQWAKYTV